MNILSKIIKMCVSSARHFGVHNGLNGHLVDSEANGQIGGKVNA